MLRARVTSKGQITVPVAVRRKLNLQPGDELTFDVNPEGEVMVRAFKRKRLTELYASLPATRKYPGKEQVRKEVAARLAHGSRSSKGKEE